VSDKEETFSERYFMDGIRSGLSSYTNYCWLGRPTEEMAQALHRHIKLSTADSLLEFGCARGYIVRALRSLGVPAYGVDISSWAVSNCDPLVKEWVSNDCFVFPRSFDWIFSKDVWEHIEAGSLANTIKNITEGAKKGVFVIVPLTDASGDYLRQEDRQDVTHQIRWEIQDWLKFISECAPDFTVEASYHIPGLKPASEKVPFSCGFFTMRRLR
jgi:cyclopropane fatty-acyl-phospholipid synthase-like methyltransferase